MKYDVDGVVAIYAFFIMLSKRRQRSVGHLAHDHFSNRRKSFTPFLEELCDTAHNCSIVVRLPKK